MGDFGGVGVGGDGGDDSRESKPSISLRLFEVKTRRGGGRIVLVLILDKSASEKKKIKNISVFGKEKEERPGGKKKITIIKKRRLAGEKSETKGRKERERERGEVPDKVLRKETKSDRFAEVWLCLWGVIFVIALIFYLKLH